MTSPMRSAACLRRPRITCPCPTSRIPGARVRLDSSSRWPPTTSRGTSVHSSTQVRLHAPHASILVIDDNSPDGTGQLADELRATLPEIHVIHRPRKLGLGTAILEGFRFAIEHGYDYLLNLDADFSHPPRFIPALLAGMRDHDVMIGSRYIPGGGVEGGVQPQAEIHEHGDQLVRPAAARPEDEGQQRGVPLLPRLEAGGDRPRPRPVAGLLVPGRDPVLVPDGRLPHG